MNQGQLNQTYSHLGHELAHPLGSGFQEILLRGQFSYKMSFIRFNYNYAKIQDIYNGNEIFGTWKVDTSNNSILLKINFETLADFSFNWRLYEIEDDNEIDLRFENNSFKLEKHCN